MIPFISLEQEPLSNKNNHSNTNNNYHNDDYYTALLPLIPRKHQQRRCLSSPSPSPPPFLPLIYGLTSYLLPSTRYLCCTFTHSVCPAAAARPPARPRTLPSLAFFTAFPSLLSSHPGPECTYSNPSLFFIFFFILFVHLLLFSFFPSYYSSS